jgi:hypothetical protein
MVGRQQAIEAHASEIRRKVFANMQRRQLIRSSTAALPPTDMNPRRDAINREHLAAHATDRGVHTGWRRANWRSHAAPAASWRRAADHGRAPAPAGTTGGGEGAATGGEGGERGDPLRSTGSCCSLQLLHYVLSSTCI